MQFYFNTKYNTKYIAFAHRSNLLPAPSYTITAHSCTSGSSSCTCSILSRTESLKYLGVTIDQSLSFNHHIAILVTRLRKLIFIFKTLKHISDRRLIKLVYFALCQSIIDYCITSWGGAAKSHLILLERAQRAILKVSLGLPYRFPTTDLYRQWNVLSVRQSFLLQITLKQHSHLSYDPEKLKGKRRKGTVCRSTGYHTSLSHHFYCFLGPYIYNSLNKILQIYPVSKYRCKLLVSNYLKTMNYEQTENMLKPPI